MSRKGVFFSPRLERGSGFTILHRVSYPYAWLISGLDSAFLAASGLDSGLLAVPVLLEACWCRGRALVLGHVSGESAILRFYIGFRIFMHNRFLGWILAFWQLLASILSFWRLLGWILALWRRLGWILCSWRRVRLAEGRCF